MEHPDTEELVNPAEVKVVPDATAPPATQATTDQQDPSWLAGRLERAKEAAMKDIARMLGVENLEKAKATLEAARKAEDERKTELQRLTERTVALEAAAKRAEQLEGVLSQRAEVELVGLTDAQRSAVLALAGEDKAAQLRAITALRPTWQAASAASTAATTPSQADSASTAAAAPRVAPASTSAATTQPASTSAQPTVDHKAEYSRLRATNPVFAAHYLQAYRSEIYPTK